MNYLNPILLLNNAPKRTMGTVWWLMWFLAILAVTVLCGLLAEMFLGTLLRMFVSSAVNAFFFITRTSLIIGIYLISVTLVNIFFHKIFTHLEAPPREKKKGTLFRLFLYFIASTAALTPIYLLLYERSSLYADLLGQLVNLILLIVIFRFYQSSERSYMEKGVFRFLYVILMLFLAVGVRIGLIFLGLVIFNETTLVAGVEEQWKDLVPTDPQSLFQYAILIVTMCVLTPIVEEFYFRGIIFDRLARKYNVLVGLVVSSLFFASVHTPNRVIFFFSLLIGLVFALVYAKFKNIWYAVILHAAFNATPFILLSMGIVE